MVKRPFNPYSVPHDCEREELALQLALLKPQQRTILRSYIHNVVYGQMNLSEWSRQDIYPRVSLPAWRKRFDRGGNYWGTEDSPNQQFRDAYNAYVLAHTTWQTIEEEKSVKRAGKLLRLGATRAAERILFLVDDGENDRIKLDAAKTVLDRASEDTAEKGSLSVGISSETFAALRSKAAEEAEQIEEEALSEWQP